MKRAFLLGVLTGVLLCVAALAVRSVLSDLAEQRAEIVRIELFLAGQR